MHDVVGTSSTMKVLFSKAACVEKMVFPSSGVASVTRRQPFESWRGTAGKEARSIAAPRAREVPFHCADSAGKLMNGSRAAVHLPEKHRSLHLPTSRTVSHASRFETTPTRQTAALAQRTTSTTGRRGLQQ